MWLRRAPVRIADASVGALAAAVVKHAGEPYERATQYSDQHGQRVMPPVVAIGAGVGFVTLLAPREIATTVKLVRAGYAYARSGKRRRSCSPGRARPRGSGATLGERSTEHAEGGARSLLDYIAADIAAKSGLLMR